VAKYTTGDPSAIPKRLEGVTFARATQIPWVRSRAIPLQPKTTTTPNATNLLAWIAAQWANVDPLSRSIWQAIHGTAQPAYNTYAGYNQLVMTWGFPWQLVPENPTDHLGFNNTFTSACNVGGRIYLSVFVKSVEGVGPFAQVPYYAAWNQGVVRRIGGSTPAVATPAPKAPSYTFVGVCTPCTWDEVTYFDITDAVVENLGSVPAGFTFDPVTDIETGTQWASQTYVLDSYATPTFIVGYPGSGGQPDHFGTIINAADAPACTSFAMRHAARRTAATARPLLRRVSPEYLSGLPTPLRSR
jgi:hypothetical protein